MPRRTTSGAEEDYLEAILDLSGESTDVRSVDVAQALGVSRASVSRAMDGLNRRGLIKKERYGTIALTEEGASHASSVRRRHDMLKLFLIEVIGIEPETAEDEACRMEHAISEHTADKWDAFLIKTLNRSDYDGCI